MEKTTHILKAMTRRAATAAAALTALAAIMLPALDAHAVTDKEMEEARAITAKAYLRYANDGSGYLDNVKATSMQELTSKLKEKEKENLKAFNSVSVPRDYAGWDKAKLVEFWSVTFFTSPALTEKGKQAKSRVKRQIQAMSVSAPAPAPAEVPAEGATPVAASVPDTVPQAATAGNAMEEQQEILADQQDIEAANEEARASDGNESTGTWIYVVVLIVLVGLVVWLMVYAANLMKKQPGGDKVTEADNEELRDKARTALIKKNEEIADLQRRLHEEEGRSADSGVQIEKLKLENRRLLDQIEKLREENARLSAARVPARETAPAPVAAPVKEPVRERRPEPRETEESPRAQLKVIYLGRANTRGYFVRADRRISAGNTIFRLDTSDGLVGTFRVVDDPQVVATALSNPVEYLAGGCTGEELDDTAGASRRLTEAAGTAIFENGYWKVLRKTRIRYE